LEVLKCVAFAVPSAQFEDPSPDLQRIREKLEVEMLLECPWVVEAATTAIATAVAAAADSEQTAEAGPSTSAANGAGAVSSGATNGAGGEQGGKSPLELPSELKARVTKELKIHPPQVSTHALLREGDPTVGGCGGERGDRMKVPTSFIEGLLQGDAFHVFVHNLLASGKATCNSRLPRHVNLSSLLVAELAALHVLLVGGLTGSSRLARTWPYATSMCH
jgi:hypothetical protein